jgi:predicted nucleic acid-binding protein
MPVLTTAWIIVELGDALCERRQRPRFAAVLQAMRADADCEIVAPTSELLDSGLDLFHSYRDKSWSLTDCISFVVMRQRGITEALTGDHHFEQAGFVALLK